MNRRVALLVIDLQTAVFEDPAMPPVFDAARLLQNARALVEAARSGGVPVVYIQHCGPAGDEFEEGRSGWQIYEPIAPRPGEAVVRKNRSDAFEGTQLQEVLESLSVRSPSLRALNPSIASRPPVAAPRSSPTRSSWRQTVIARGPARRRRQLRSSRNRT